MNIFNNVDENWMDDAKKVMPSKQEVLEAPITITLTLKCDISDLFSEKDIEYYMRQALYFYHTNDTRKDMWDYIANELEDTISLDCESLQALLDKYFKAKFSDTSMNLKIWE